MIEDRTPESPAWWLRRLEAKLDERQPGIKHFDDYYSGEHRLGFASSEFRRAFGALFSRFADNWCELVVDAVEERLNVEGFRLGRDISGDQRAWRIWQTNHLDAESQTAHTEALISGESYVLVWAGDDRVPSITVEHPAQVTVINRAGIARERAAALKRWIDDDGFRYATLYLPDAVYKFRSAVPAKEGSRTAWTDREVNGEPWPLPNRLGVVPVVPMVNRSRLLKPGRSELHSVVPVQDAVNKLITDLLVTSEFSAAPQRWATGIEIPKDPATGQPIQVFENLVSRLWTSKSKDTTFGEFDQADLANFVQAIEMLIQHIASQTRTPPHYFYLRGEFPSGESIKSAETGLVAKAQRKMRHFGEAWEEVMRLGFAVIGDERRARVQDSETLWGDPESRSESELADSVMKKRALGVPLQQCWADLGYSPQQIERFKEMLREEAEFGVTVGGAMPPLIRADNGSSPVPA